MLYEMLCSYNKVISEPASMNSMANKEERADYVSTVVASHGDHERLHVIYIDEFNSNLFLCRSQG